MKKTSQTTYPRDRSGALAQVLVCWISGLLRMSEKKMIRGFTSASEERRGHSYVHGVRMMTKQTRRGFTLIETFVAISVLLVSLAGPLSIAAQALKSAYYARDEITAFYLAQEGLEYARAVRDQNYLSGRPWLTDMDGCINIACQIDFPNFTGSACPNNSCQALLIDQTSNLFNARSGTPSGFTRIFTLVPIEGVPGEIAVTVRVSWVSAGISRSFRLSEHLFDWL